MWLAWLLPMSLSGFFVFGIHYTENYALIGVGAFGSIAAVVAYFVGNRHRASDTYETHDLEEGMVYEVLWKEPRVFGCLVVLRDIERGLFQVKLSEENFRVVDVNESYRVDRFEMYNGSFYQVLNRLN